jgi:hypothetical protein
VNTRRTAAVALIAAVLAFLVVFFSPSSIGRRLRHRLQKTAIGAQIQLSKWRGHPPRLASVSGQVETAGTEVQALDSRSGWASLSDPDGRFTLPDVLWYPGAGYDILISTDYEQARFARVSTSSTLPPDGVFQAGRLNAAGSPVSLISQPGVNSYNREVYDEENRDYYVDLYQRLTAGKDSDDQKVNAVNEFIGTKLNYEQTGEDLGSARRVIERGSQWCGHLAVAMATVIVTGYRTRILHMMDSSLPPHTHAVVEVFYAGGWHLYDPTFGTRFLDQKGQVASYKTLRLNPSLVSDDVFSNYRRRYPKADSISWMPAVYSSGYHHFFLIDFARP